MKIGSTNINDCKIGSTQIKEIRQGVTLIWPDVVVPSELSISPTNYEAVGVAESLTIQVTSNVAWLATSENSWITITSSSSGNGSGSITISLAENNNQTGIRTGNVRFEGGGITRYFGVNQEAKISTVNWDFKSYWSFEESTGVAIDKTGWKDLIVDSGVVRPVSGIIGNAYNFTNGRAGVGNNFFYDFSENQVNFEIAIQAWVKFTSDNDGKIFSQEYNTSRWVSRFWYDSTNKELFFILRGEDENNGGYIGRKITNFDIKLNNWQHLIMTYDGGNTNAAIKLYQNSVRKDNADKNSGTFGSYSATSALGINIGLFPGHLDEMFFLRGRLLTENEIDYLYNNGNGVLIM